MLNTAVFRRCIVVAVMVALTVSACASGGNVRPSVTPELFTATPSPVPPTATPLPADVMYVPAAGADAARVSAVRTALTELTQESGLRMEERSHLEKDDLNPAWKLVISVGADASFADWAKTNPKIHFVALDGQDLKPQANLTVIGAARPEDQAFLAGLIAAMVTPDWRVGVLTRAGNAADQKIALGFLNGARYLCGICNPLSPPYPGYPVSVELENAADWQTGLSSLVEKGVTTLYMPAELQSDEILLGAVNAKMRFISAAPDAVPETLRSQMIAGVRADPVEALRTAWPDLLAGTLNPVSLPALGVSDVQTDLLTTGRMRLVEDVRQQLESGMLYSLEAPGK